MVRMRGVKVRECGTVLPKIVVAWVHNSLLFKLPRNLTRTLAADAQFEDVTHNLRALQVGFDALRVVLTLTVTERRSLRGDEHKHANCQGKKFFCYAKQFYCRYAIPLTIFAYCADLLEKKDG